MDRAFYRSVITRVVVLFSVGMSSGCAPLLSSSFNSIRDPDYDASSIGKLAVFPIRNSWIPDDKANRLLTELANAIDRKNDNVAVIGWDFSHSILVEKNLQKKWDDFLRDYWKTGKPDSNVIREVGSAINVDAIMQCEITYIMRRPGSFWESGGATYVTLHYMMFGVREGKLLWEASGAAVGVTSRFQTSPPSVYSVASEAQRSITSSLPF